MRMSQQLSREIYLAAIAKSVLPVIAKFAQRIGPAPSFSVSSGRESV
jgi:hypothetical protein